MAKSIFNLYATDPSAETEKGLTIDFGEYGKIRLLRAGGANKQFGKRMTERLKPYRRQIDNETADDTVIQRIMAEVYAETIIIGWEGIIDADGSELPFSKQNCVKLFTACPDLFRDIQAEAVKAANFRAEERADDAKNSAPASAGTSPTGTN